MIKCMDCGILSKSKDGFICVRFEKALKAASINEGHSCQYFIKIVYEDGEPLSPQQHLNMQDGENRSRKMRGPV